MRRINTSTLIIMLLIVIALITADKVSCKIGSWQVIDYVRQEK